MSKRRLLRYALVALALLAFTGWFAFATFLFNPLESDFEGDLSDLIPRDVDLYVSKAGLRSDLRRFPPEPGGEGIVRSLAGGEDLLDQDAVRRYVGSPEYADLDRSLGLEAGLEKLRASLAQAPVEIDPLDLYGGRDVAFAAYAPAAKGGEPDWAAYARAGFLGKLGASLLAYPGVLGLDRQGVTVTEKSGVVELRGAGLPRPLYLSRVADVVVVGTAEKLARAAIELEELESQDSLGQSAGYADNVARARRSGDELELHWDARTWLDKTQPGFVWPKATEWVVGGGDVGSAIGARFFQVGILRSLAGAIAFGHTTEARLHADLDPSAMTPVMKRVYRNKGFTKDELYAAAALAPADACVFAYAHAGVSDLLDATFETAERAAQTNLNDVVRSVWGHPDARKLFAELDAALKGRVALVVLPNVFPDEGESGPPHDDQGALVFTWAVVGWMESPQRIIDIRRKVDGNPGAFGIRGRESGTSGVYTNKVEGGFEVYEYWQMQVPGTGHISICTANDQLFISNHHKLIGRMLKCLYAQGAEAELYPKLSERGEFGLAVQSGLDRANLALWIDPREAADTLRLQAQRRAADEFMNEVDWKSTRQQYEQQVLKQSFPGQTVEALGEDDRARLEKLVDDELARFRKQKEDTELVEKQQEYERQIDYARLASVGLLEIALGEKQIEVFLRALVPLDG